MPGFPCSPFREVFLLCARNSELVVGMLDSSRKGSELAVPPGQAEGQQPEKRLRETRSSCLENIMAIQLASGPQPASRVWRHVSKWIMSEIWRWKLIFINHDIPGNRQLHGGFVHKGAARNAGSFSRNDVQSRKAQREVFKAPSPFSICSLREICHFVKMMKSNMMAQRKVGAPTGWESRGLGSCLILRRHMTKAQQVSVFASMKYQNLSPSLCHRESL